MNHSLFTWSKFNKCAKFFDAYNSTSKDLSLCKVSGDNLDHFDCFVHHLCVCATYRYSTVIGNVDLNACAVNDLVDRLSSLSDYITDLVRIDLDLNDLRCECADFFSRLLDCF